MRRLRMLAPLLLACLQAHAQSGIDELKLDAPGVSDKPVRVRVLLPPDYADGTVRYPVLYMNDGQDLEAIGVEATLEQLYAGGEIEPLIVVAIDMPPDRMGGYGLFDRRARHSIPAQTRYGPVGMNAWAYARWITGTLVPAVDGRYRTQARAERRAILGWSLGGLSAFGIGWQYPELFGTVGAFSPSFWVSADRSDTDAIQATRLAQRLVDSGAPTLRPDMFVAVGDAEETGDRDRDGIIDVVDDARDLFDGWAAPDGHARKGLRQWGYAVDTDDATQPVRDSAMLHVFVGGKHEQASWARMLPVFLRWALGENPPSFDADAARPASVESREAHPR
jgi:enterochelin esterase-like enzyme